MCDLCKKVVDYEAIVENRPGLGKNFVTILVKHHGLEDRQEFDMGTEQWGEDQFSRVLCRYRWFSPETVMPEEHVGLGDSIYVDGDK